MEQTQRRQFLAKELRELDKDLETIEKILKIVNKRIQEDSIRKKLEQASASKKLDETVISQRDLLYMKNVCEVLERTNTIDQHKK